MSQKRLAEKIGVEERTIKRWEEDPTGHPPSPEMREVLLETLPLDPETFDRAVRLHRVAAVKIQAGGEAAKLVSRLRIALTKAVADLQLLEDLMPAEQSGGAQLENPPPAQRPPTVKR